MPKPTPAPKDNSLEAKLDEIILHLQRLDARDKLRTWGSLLRTLFSIVPLIIFLLSLWYIAANGPALMKEIANIAASAAAEYTKNQGQSMYDQILNRYQVPNQK